MTARKSAISMYSLSAVDLLSWNDLESGRSRRSMDHSHRMAGVLKTVSCYYAKQSVWKIHCRELRFVGEESESASTPGRTASVSPLSWTADHQTWAGVQGWHDLAVRFHHSC